MDSIVPTSMHASSAMASRCSRIIGNLLAGMYPSGRLGAAIMQAMVWAGPIWTDKKILEAGPRIAPCAYSPAMSICFPSALKSRWKHLWFAYPDGIRFRKIINLDIVQFN
ncbi:hypothetical protein [Achromobacter xylosoxidans]|uniref:hypothetical protein n=1 Tax=Alcaligenes xylosoxydans xylosoxydans TaxID=85698 RepID=UPI001390AAA6|nr:hypothetical protein [Achromobacter xylosoxidans]